MALPPPRPRDSPTELERERLGRGDGAVGGRTRGGGTESVTEEWDGEREEISQ